MRSRADRSFLSLPPLPFSPSLLRHAFIQFIVKRNNEKRKIRECRTCVVYFLLPQISLNQRLTQTRTHAHLLQRLKNAYRLLSLIN
jgi:hypothetical protein